ncbi:STAS domain-containing protein [Streptomyces chrestomyceticus]|uniref:STAS domain-containing protein n=1 Tax=Streptomyces chrestomyceticus TaxID=68185 RepID=UPI0019CF92B9|nr:STAS domain-containing protein [Streptomyces chrestomyceticus]
MVEQGRSYASREHVVGATTVVVLSGEVDILAATALTARLDEITGVRRPDLVLDVREVTFIDCCGMSMLCRTRRRVEAKAGRLRLAGVADSPSVLRLLRLTGLLPAFDLRLDPDPDAIPGLTAEPRPDDGCSCTHPEGGGHPAAPDTPSDTAVA